MVVDVEMNEMLFGPAREQVNSASNHHDENVVKQLVIRMQLEKQFKEDHSATSAYAQERSHRTKVREAYNAEFGVPRRITFGPLYWETDADWPFFLRMASRYLNHSVWWLWEADDQLFTLKVGEDDTCYALPAPLHFEVEDVKSVQKKLDVAYENLQGGALFPRTLLRADRPAARARNREPDDGADDDEAELEHEQAAGAVDEGESAINDEEESTTYLALRNGADAETSESSDEEQDEEDALESWKVVAASYEGDTCSDGVKNNIPHGYGVQLTTLREEYTHSEKETIFHGRFVNGTRDGYGVERCGERERWKGKWKADCLHGLGEREWDDGMLHKGEFDAGIPDGPGFTHKSESESPNYGIFSASAKGRPELLEEGEWRWPTCHKTDIVKAMR